MLVIGALVLAHPVRADEHPANTRPTYKIVAPKLTRAPVIDGRLDDSVWKEALVVSDFTQVFPHGGVPAEERTEVFIGYDADTLFVGFRCESADPPSRET